jgi:hypothetical protein
MGVPEHDSTEQPEAPPTPDMRSAAELLAQMQEHQAYVEEVFTRINCLRPNPSNLPQLYRRSEVLQISKHKCKQHRGRRWWSKVLDALLLQGNHRGSGWRPAR